MQRRVETALQQYSHSIASEPQKVSPNEETMALNFSAPGRSYVSRPRRYIRPTILALLVAIVSVTLSLGSSPSATLASYVPVVNYDLPHVGGEKQASAIPNRPQQGGPAQSFEIHLVSATCTSGPVDHWLHVFEVNQTSIMTLFRQAIRITGTDLTVLVRAARGEADITVRHGDGTVESMIVPFDRNSPLNTVVYGGAEGAEIAVNVVGTPDTGAGCSAVWRYRPVELGP